MRDPNSELGRQVVLDRERRVEQFQTHEAELKTLHHQSIERSRTERIMDAVTGQARAREMRVLELQENMQMLRAQEQRTQQFLAQENAAREQQRAQYLGQDIEKDRFSREVAARNDRSQDAYWVGSRDPIGSVGYQRFIDHHECMERAHQGYMHALYNNMTFWGGADRFPHPNTVPAKSEYERMQERQAQFDQVREHQQRPANDDRLSPTDYNMPRDSHEQRDFDRAAERQQDRQATGERIADASHGFEGGDGGGQSDKGRDEQEWER